MEHTSRYTNENSAEIFNLLSDPFGADEIHWRLLSKTKDGKRGLFCAYASVCSYIDRLNNVLGHQGWSKTVSMQTTAATALVKEKTLQSTLILVTVGIEIHGLAKQESTAESWAHENNAATSPEAKAFKRAAEVFGLGRHLKNVPNQWAEIDNYGVPLKAIAAPRFNEDGSYLAPGHAESRPQARPEAQQQRPGPQAVQQKGSKQTTGSSVVRPSEWPRSFYPFQNLFGEKLFRSAMKEIGARRPYSVTSDSQKERFYVDEFTKLKSRFQAVQSVAENNQALWISIMDKYKVETMDGFVSLRQFDDFYSDISAAHQNSARRTPLAKAA